MDRKIIHLDMDAFFASIEERDNPELKGKPVIVGARPGTRGVVSTCNYEARKYGVRSAMSSAEAYRRCPNAVFVDGHYEKYVKASGQVHAIMEEYTDCIEFLSLDEGYMDVTGSERVFGSAESIALAIQKRVYETVGTTCSVGVGYNMLSAKTASEEKKPRGFYVIKNSEEFYNLMRRRPVGVLYGIGKKTAEHLLRIGIHTVEELAAATPWQLSCFGKNGAEMKNYARGIDKREIMPNQPQKSIGKETTFPSDVTDMSVLKDTLLLLSRTVSDRMKARNRLGHSITLKIKYADMQSITRSCTVSPTNTAADVYKAASEMLEREGIKRPIRLIGVTSGKLSENDYEQISLFDDGGERKEKNERLDGVVTDLRKEYGRDKLKTAKELLAEKRLVKYTEGGKR